jgi:hypothetical protein
MNFNLGITVLMAGLLSCTWMGCEKNEASKEMKPVKAVQKTPPTPSPASAKAPSPSEATPSTDLSSRYKKQAEELIAAIKGKQADGSILKMANALTNSGRQFLPGLVKKYPACKAYLDAVAEVATTMKDLPLEDIERDYHQDGKLPKMPDGNCYHGKDLVVHPATVAAMATKGIQTDEERKSAEHEIAEVLAHLSAVAK